MVVLRPSVVLIAIMLKTEDDYNLIKKKSTIINATPELPV